MRELSDEYSLIRVLADGGRELWAGQLWMELKGLSDRTGHIEQLIQKLDEPGDADPRVIRLVNFVHFAVPFFTGN